MYYHPLIGVTIFLLAVVISFFLGINAFKKYKYRIKNSNLEILKNKTQSSPPQGEITAPDAPWIKK